MSQNRLHLDFSLVTQEERNAFLTQYLTQDIFKQLPPTEDELATMADYLLWGKNEQGKNGKQSGLDLRSKHGTWDDSPIDSLDQLLEQPTFSEASLSTLGSTQYRTKKQVFSRTEALAQCRDPFLREQLNALFSSIDELDLLINLYDELHGRRTKPIRPLLLNKFSQEQVDEMREKVSHWNQYHYLKKRHLLVELRREQYTLRDSFSKVQLSAPTEQFVEDEVFDFDAGIEVLPLGLIHEDEVSTLIFRTWRELVPDKFSEENYHLISDLYWQKQAFNKKLQSAQCTSDPGALFNKLPHFDFRELEHVYNLLEQENNIAGYLPELDISSNLKFLLDTLQFYISQADLTDIQVEILQMKMQKVKNVDIAAAVNKKYGKNYTQNYISTIFRQKIIPKINHAASYHEEIIANIFFPEEFKTCCRCGETMLRTPDNFMRRSRSSDGFSSRCKRCEKEARQGG